MEKSEAQTNSKCNVLDAERPLRDSSLPNPSLQSSAPMISSQSSSPKSLLPPTTSIPLLALDNGRSSPSAGDRFHSVDCDGDSNSGNHCGCEISEPTLPTDGLDDERSMPIIHLESEPAGQRSSKESDDLVGSRGVST